MTEIGSAILAWILVLFLAAWIGWIFVLAVKALVIELRLWKEEWKHWRKK